MCKTALAFLLLLQLAANPVPAQANSANNNIDSAGRAQAQGVITRASGPLRMSLLQRTEGLNELAGFGVPSTSGWLPHAAKREPRNLWMQQPAVQERGWIRRHPALFGALVGAGAGAVAAGTMDNELFCSGGDDDCVFYGASRVVAGAGMGAGIGALVGWVVGLAAR